MKRNLAMAICAASLASGANAADVGVSIQFSQPGVFGRIDIGQYPRPQVIVAQPMIVEPPPPAMPPREPVYLWVPPEHRQHWKQHCREYHACGHPVYFVDNAWYRNNVTAGGGARHEGRREDDRRGEHGRSEEEHGRHEGRGEGRGEGHGEKEHDRGRD